jgi:hypothetical protein
MQDSADPITISKELVNSVENVGHQVDLKLLKGILRIKSIKFKFKYSLSRIK